MSKKHRGAQSVAFEKPVYLIGRGCVGGVMEGKGPLARHFDILASDALWGEDSFEKAERKFFFEAAKKAIEKGKKSSRDIDFLVGGDLLNQIISASFSARDLDIPYLGLYGACSSMAESLAIGSMIVDGGFASHVLCATSSHFGAAERQFRFPLELGTPKPPTGQNTATAAGASLLSDANDLGDPGCPVIRRATIGNVVDFGVTDANNMGAAMAPAAAETILNHLEDFSLEPDYYDKIVTGDLGTFGSELLIDLAKQVSGTDLSKVHYDCGASLYAGLKKVYCGASGCGCSASVLNGYLLDEMQAGRIRRILFVATGALHSPTSAQQGESIPGIAHGVAIERGDV
ncbi:MAG: stage V sporulation protein AD [Clostridiales bacterium]|nr:stage V sporulation protein AD [Clostridiales bacterium]